MEEEQKTFKQQETFKVDVWILPKKRWRPIYEVIDTSFFAAKKLFPTAFLDQCKKLE